MNRKKKIYIAVLLLCIVIIVIAFVIISINNTNKNIRFGGEEEYRFTIGSSELSISDGSKTVILTGEDRKAVVNIMQNIIGNAEDATDKNAEYVIDKNAEYNITIDFKNGYKAYISSDKMLLHIDLWDKRMDEQNLKTLLSYLNS
jgi:hypothetical protein